MATWTPTMRRTALVVVAAAGLALAVALLPVADALDALLAWVEGLGAWGPVVFVGVYVLVTVLLLPTWGFSIGGGALFGTALGLPLVFAGAASGATLAFLLGRTLLRERVEPWAARRPRLAAVDAEIERRGWLVAALFRLSPLVPYNVLNYALGLTSLSLVGFLASLLAMLPVLALYVSLGSALGAAATSEGRTRTPLEWVLLGVGVAATLVVTLWLGRIASRGLPRGDGEG